MGLCGVLVTAPRSLCFKVIPAFVLVFIQILYSGGSLACLAVFKIDHREGHLNFPTFGLNPKEIFIKGQGLSAFSLLETSALLTETPEI